MTRKNRKKEQDLQPIQGTRVIWSEAFRHGPVEMKQVKEPASQGESEKLRELSKRITDLEEMNRDLLGMVENSYDGLAIVDGETRLLLLNPGFERVMGLTNAEIIGRPIRDLVAEGISDTAATVKVLETQKAQTVIINTMAGRQVLSTGVPVFDRDGTIVRIYCNLRDITELNQLKEKFEQSQKLISKYLVELHEVKQHRTMQQTFIAHSKRMKQIMETAYRLARVDTSVLVLGESGVGKELVARIIHDASPRAEMGAFVKINCGAIPGELLESELFGYEAGAFTGASKEGKAGYFEIADKGTLLLDEIGDLPLKLQVKLLAVIQDQEVTRVGGVRPKKVDVRIIAATNQDLEKMVTGAKFREDLFYRLNVVPLYIPPLRERKEDIPFLLIHYLNRYNDKYHQHFRLSKEAVEKLCVYQWPGNVRELANLMEHLVVVSNEETLRPEHIPAKYLSPKEEEQDLPSTVRPLKNEVERYEISLIKSALRQSTTLEETAHKLGVSLSTLTRRMRTIKTDGQ